ncbi:MAG: family 78 glycoside hydrolase catalytic domain [Clostridia bacterium]|nr:family 78 glycoside hydrolase catalytic domain [Clostridia bacterium]
MKKATFVSNPVDIKQKHEHPWKRPGGMIFNSKSIDFPAGNGQVLFMRRFSLNDSPRAVRVRATALGIFELYLNGERVGSRTSCGDTVYDELKPTWTDYRSRVFECEYDVTGAVRDDNVLLAEVSCGWWSGRISFGIYGFKPSAFCGEIEIEYADGRSELIYDGWQTAIGGRVRTADIWDGEYYDARVADPAVAPETLDWCDAVPTEDITCKITSPVGEPIRRRCDLIRAPQSAVVHCGTVDNATDYGEIKVVSKCIGDGCERLTLRAGESVILDFGQNMVGRPLMTVKAPRDTIIRGYFAELLNDSGLAARGNDGAKGSMYIKNYRSALARLTYVASGDGEECFEPLHTFYGFRYFELTADRDIEIVAVRGVVITSELAETGSIETDNTEVNQLISNIIWGQRGNYLSVPTDCPQRDERLGWTGDTQIFCGAASYLCDIRGFMKKWLGDARDSQTGEKGAYCDVIPRVFAGGNNGNAAWGDAGLIVPYRLWLMYRDYDTVAEHYDSMEEYMHYLEQFGLEGPNTAYGDWLNYDVTDKRYIAIAYYACDADLMVKFSEILGKAERAAYYRDLHSRIVAHFREKYVVDGMLTVQTQTSCLLALKFDLLTSEVRAATVELLRKLITENNYTLSTGFVGTGILNQTLSELGMDDLCYSLLLQTADPSWLYSVRQGATTVWERWNSYTLERGFGDVGMNSFNHYAYGAVLEWMFSGMAGIRPDAEHPGFERFILAPRPDKRTVLPEGQHRIGHVAAKYKSMRGDIESGWDRVGEDIVYNFVIPEGTVAALSLDISRESVNMNGVDFSANELGGTKNGGEWRFELRSGKYIIK